MNTRYLNNFKKFLKFESKLLMKNTSFWVHCVLVILYEIYLAIQKHLISIRSAKNLLTIFYKKK